MIKVSLSGVAIISDYTQKQKEKITEDLTVKNPAFENAKRYGRFGTGKIPEFIEYFEDAWGKMMIPRGYHIPFDYEVVEDNRLVNDPVPYPDLHIEPRETQEEASYHYLKKLKESREEYGVITMDTGKGKSILGLYLARKLQQRVLVIVQKDDLVSGWKQDANVALGLRPKEVGLIKGKDFRLGEQVTISTIQTLSKLDEEKIRELHNYFGMVIVDEFHHSVAKIYNAINYFPARFKIGLTATAMRSDGLDEVMFMHFGKKAYEFVATEDDEDILPVTVKIRNIHHAKFNPERRYIVMPTYYKGAMNALHESPDFDYGEARELLSDVFTESMVEDKFPGVDFDKLKKCCKAKPTPISEIRQAIGHNENFNTTLVKDVKQEVEENKSCVIFTHEKDHCDIIEHYLKEAGVDAETIQKYYGDSKTSKDEMKRRAESKQCLVTIATYAIATEGTNVKAWERGFLATTVANKKDTIQSIGRCRRTKDGKDDCLIYDYRFLNIKGADKHGKVRDDVYREKGFETIGTEAKKKRKSTGRGWNHILGKNLK